MYSDESVCALCVCARQVEREREVEEGRSPPSAASILCESGNSVKCFVVTELNSQWITIACVLSVYT